MLVLEIIYGVFAFILGACFGSFSSVLICRMPKKMSIVKPASHCFECGEPIKWYDNIPILSYLILRGKCRHCGAKYGPESFFIELFTACMYLATYLRFGKTISTIIICLIITMLVVLSMIDYKEFLIPESMIIGLALASIPFFFLEENVFQTDYVEKLIGVGMVLLIFLVFLLAGRLLKRPLIGFGDIQLLITFSLIVGYKNVLFTIFVAALIAVIVEVIIKRKKKGEAFAFGPYLSMGFLIAMFFGPMIINAYLSLFN